MLCEKIDAVIASLVDTQDRRIDICVPFTCVLHEINADYFPNLLARKGEQVHA